MAKPPADAPLLDEVPGETAADDPRYAPRYEEPPADPVIEERVPEVPKAAPAIDQAWLAAYLEKVRKEQTLVGRVKKRLADLMLYWPVVLCGIGIVAIIAVLVASGIRTPREIREEMRTFR